MTTGEKIRYFREQKKMSRKKLGMAVGFDEKSADNRIRQYEFDIRTPKQEMRQILASALDISPIALNASRVESIADAMQALFDMEDILGLEVQEKGGRPQLIINAFSGDEFNNAAAVLNSWLRVWIEKKTALVAGEITQEEYDRWRYSWPPLRKE